MFPIISDCIHLAAWRSDTNNCRTIEPGTGMMALSASQYDNNVDLCWVIRQPANVVSIIMYMNAKDWPFIIFIGGNLLKNTVNNKNAHCILI